MYKSITIFNELNQNNLGEWALDFDVTPLNWAAFDVGQTVNIVSEKALFGAVDEIAIDDVIDSTVDTDIVTVIDDGVDDVIIGENAGGGLNAGASVIGFYDMSLEDGNDATQPGSITIGGHTAVDIHDLSAVELAGLDVLVVQNPSNSSYGAEYLAALPAIQAAVAAGMTLIIHDRATGNADANTILPGGGAMTFVRSTDPDDIEVVDDLHPFTTGPGGTVTDLSLDGGSSSYHGYANIGSLPAGTEVLLTTPDASRAVTFHYEFGAGRVFYSSIPIDYYLAGNGGSVAATMAAYLGNLIDYAAFLIGGLTPGDDVYVGTSGADDVDGLAGADLMSGNMGDDILRGGDGNDEVHGNQGDDTIFGDGGDDRLFGEAGDDVIDGGDGADHVSGGNGADVLNGGAGDDRLLGGNDNDLLSGGKGNDRVIGGDGNDVLHGNAGDDRLFGGNGDDRMLGEAGADLLRGGDGADHLSGGDGMDELYGEDGDDRLLGGNDDDFLSGGKGNDRVIGGDGNDELHGNRGDDRLFGEAGDDRMFGEAGNDLLRGGAGADFISGGTDADILEGGDGDDRLLGDGGADRLEGGAGADSLIGGTEADIFAFDFGVMASGQDTIFDFEVGVDAIEIAGSITYADLTLTASLNGQHTTISYNGHSIFVKNVTVADLGAAQFDFTLAEPAPIVEKAEIAELIDADDSFNFINDKTVIVVSEELNFDPLTDANVAEFRATFLEGFSKTDIYEDVELVDNTDFDFTLDYWG